MRRARTVGGIGLGLAIAMEDANLHGGWLTQGRPAMGAQFRLTLPRKAGRFSKTSLPAGAVWSIPVDQARRFEAHRCPRSAGSPPPRPTPAAKTTVSPSSARVVLRGSHRRSQFVGGWLCDADFDQSRRQRDSNLMPELRERRVAPPAPGDDQKQIARYPCYPNYQPNFR